MTPLRHIVHNMSERLPPAGHTTKIADIHVIHCSQSGDTKDGPLS